MIFVSANQVRHAISLAISQGFQVSPDAVALLQKLAEKKRDLPLDLILSSVIEDKAKNNAEKNVSANDLQRLFPDEFLFLVSQSTSSTESDFTPSPQQPDEKSEFEILKDPSDKIQPTGTEGFAQLFKSRYEKLTKIFMERPEGRQLVKISKINYEAKGSVKVSGLVFAKRPTKNGGVEISLDDDSGKATVLALTN